MKYTDTQIVFREVPDEISLAINISNCPNHCKGCHSKELWEDIGTELNEEVLEKLILEHTGITCVAFMGGDASVDEVIRLARYVKEEWGLKTCWYSGRDLFIVNTNNESLYFYEYCGYNGEVKYNICHSVLDYIKIGHYDENFGPLDNKNTNQRMYQYIIDEDDNSYWKDITYKFNGNKE